MGHIVSSCGPYGMMVLTHNVSFNQEIQYPWSKKKDVFTTNNEAYQTKLLNKDPLVV